MVKDVIDAKFEVITGPSPVHWQKPPEVRKSRVTWYQWAYMGLICLLAGFVLLLGLSGADIDTRDDVQAWKDRQPVAAKLP